MSPTLPSAKWLIISSAGALFLLFVLWDVALYLLRRYCTGDFLECELTYGLMMSTIFQALFFAILFFFLFSVIYQIRLMIRHRKQKL